MQERENNQKGVEARSRNQLAYATLLTDDSYLIGV